MTPEQRRALVQKIHDSNIQIALAMTGGGSDAISDLLTCPGASRTILEAVVPYSGESLANFLGVTPVQACSPWVARRLAIFQFDRWCKILANQKKRAFQNELRQKESQQCINPGTEKCCEEFSAPIPLNLIGFGCTASLATDRVKKGAHRFHIAIQSYNSTSVFSLILDKGARTREEEERLVADHILKYIAAAAEIPMDPNEYHIPLKGEERITSRRTIADSSWIELFFGTVAAVLYVDGKPVFKKKSCDIGSPNISPSRPFSPEAEYMQAIFPGSFAPIHQGHLRMIDLAQQRFSDKIALEITIQNVEKAPLDYMDIEQRLQKIEEVLPQHGVWLTKAIRFIDKAFLFRRTMFIVGADTLQRIGDQKYYGDNHSLLMDVLRIITYCGNRFLVFARPNNGKVENLQNLNIPDMLRTLCDDVPEHLFCENISSTEIRKQLGDDYVQ